MKPSIALVAAENYQIRRDVIGRAARVDALTPDRSAVWMTCPQRAISSEMEAAEQKLSAQRASFTVQDRIEAYRQLFAMPKVQMKGWTWR